MYNNPQILINNTYLTVEKIGAGGFGEVYKAIDLSFKNFVAVKSLFKKYSENINFVSMFYNEASIAKTLIHDNIVRIYHFWVDEKGRYYILMDYVYGKGLDYIIEKCRKQKISIPYEVSCYIALILAKVLHYLHNTARHPLTGIPYNLVYMDLSPGNVLVSFDGKIKITDFGVTRTKQAIEQEKSSFIVGKYAYMSPEQIMGEKLDFRTDIYSLGIILYELLTLEDLSSKNPQEIKEFVTQDKFDFNNKIKALSVSKDILDILEKALKKNREERYSSSLEMYRDIRSLFKEKFEEDIETHFVEFIKNILNEERETEKKKQDVLFENLDVSKIINNSAIEKVQCIDYIPGTTTVVIATAKSSSSAAESNQTIQPSEEEEKKTKKELPQEETPLPEQPLHIEEKGKTIFEEAGNWILQKMRIYKKRIINIMFGLFISLITFLTLDIFVIPSHITIYGKKIYSYLFPADIVVSLTPPKGRIKIISRKTGEQIYSASYVSPVEVRKLVPGSYEIVAETEGLPTIKKVITISEDMKSKKQQIELVYTINLAIYSDPSGASVYINGTKVGKTPFTSEVLAEKTAIQLEYSGFEKLGSVGKEEKEGKCIVDFTQTQQEKIFKNVDTKYWVAKSSDLGNQGFTYILIGKIPKKIDLNSDPSNVEVFVDDETRSVGFTPLSLLFTKGTYKIYFKPSYPYQPTTLEIEVSENSLANYNVELKKALLIYVFDKKTKNPIKAKFAIINTDIKGITSYSSPAKVYLLPRSYKISFSDLEDKYISESFVYNVRNIDRIIAFLQPKKAKILFKIFDATTNQPVENAYIWINEQVLGKVDKNGEFTAEVSGVLENYNIKIVASNYDVVITTTNVSISETRVMTIYLLPSIIKCPNCSTEYPSNTQFENCIKCGTKLPKEKK